MKTMKQIKTLPISKLEKTLQNSYQHELYNQSIYFYDIHRNIVAISKDQILNLYYTQQDQPILLGIITNFHLQDYCYNIETINDICIVKKLKSPYNRIISKENKAIDFITDPLITKKQGSLGIMAEKENMLHFEIGSYQLQINKQMLYTGNQKNYNIINNVRGQFLDNDTDQQQFECNPLQRTNFHKEAPIQLYKKKRTWLSL